MKTRHFTIIAIVVMAALTLAGCSTSVAYTVTVPSEVSLGAFRNIAVASTEYTPGLIDFSYIIDSDVVPVKDEASAGTYVAKIPQFKTLYTPSEGIDAAAYAGSVIERALNQGYYKITGGKVTDALITVGKGTGSIIDQFKNNGLEVLVKSSITGIGHQEHIEVRGLSIKPQGASESHKVYEVYYVQKASITLSYQVINIEANNYIFTDSITKEYNRSTYLGRIDPLVNSGAFKKADYTLRKFSAIYRELLDNCYSQLRDSLTPHMETFYVNLMKNKAKDKTLDTAYELADEGFYMDSYKMFLKNWESTSYAVAGYNAAVLLGAMGDFEEGARLAREVFERTAYVNALRLEDSLVYYSEMRDRAKEQLTAQAPVSAMTNDLIGF